MLDPIALAEKLRERRWIRREEKILPISGRPLLWGHCTAIAWDARLRCRLLLVLAYHGAADKIGRFYSPEEVARNLIPLPERKGSSGFGSAAMNHASSLSPLNVLKLVPTELILLWRRNGILIGHDPLLRQRFCRVSQIICPSEPERSKSEDFTTTNSG